MSKSETCSNCRFWHEFGPETAPADYFNEQGRRPKTYELPTRLCRVFPSYTWRDADDWCGQWEGGVGVVPIDPH